MLKLDLPSVCILIFTVGSRISFLRSTLAYIGACLLACLQNFRRQTVQIIEQQQRNMKFKQTVFFSSSSSVNGVTRQTIAKINCSVHISDIAMR